MLPVGLRFSLLLCCCHHADAAAITPIDFAMLPPPRTCCRRQQPLLRVIRFPLLALAASFDAFAAVDADADAVDMLLPLLYAAMIRFYFADCYAC